ncbi:hypothetical protein OS493_008778 [Desmophyllum pertusum]|uniref:Uncharacterized protein n=1 Tax=Desmophyllum pertusum TaxID=174260 RepID=A0A9W9ZRY1_9CNID|nr:hypothetical protein OS493_008778 [Desmophyllum pertusum]
MLRRSKLDANRDIHEATFHVPDAIKAYKDYNDFISQARSAITGRGLLLDIHGYAGKLPKTKLGYLVGAENLNCGNYVKEVTSIRNLGKHWCGSNNTCFRDLICGNRSLGHFMNHEGLQAVPSPQNKKVKQGGRYFPGGYTLRKYGSRDGGDIDAIQMEFPAELRSRWGDDDDDTKHAVVKAILSFYKLNYVT